MGGNACVTGVLCLWAHPRLAPQEEERLTQRSPRPPLLSRVKHAQRVHRMQADIAALPCSHRGTAGASAWGAREAWKAEGRRLKEPPRQAAGGAADGAAGGHLCAAVAWGAHHFPGGGAWMGRGEGEGGRRTRRLAVARVTQEISPAAAAAAAALRRTTPPCVRLIRPKCDSVAESATGRAGRFVTHLSRTAPSGRTSALSCRRR